MTIRQAFLEDLEQLVPLFDGYRVFYQQASNTEQARAFLHARLTQQQSIIFMAFKGEEAIGFTQLYPLFSSVSMKEVYLLNDIFVLPHLRGQGVGEQLLAKAQKFAKTKNLKGLMLETAEDNPAQKLYEKMGWVKEAGFYHYFWKA